MKYHTTKKEIKNNYNRILGIGYCQAHHLLKWINPVSYCSGVYGWSCDNYDIDGVMISTGYNYIGSVNMQCDYDKLKAWDKMAAELQDKLKRDHTKSWQDKKDEMQRLLIDFVNSCKV